MGRRKIIIDERMKKTLRNAAEMQCTQEEMAAILGISYETFRLRKQEDPELDEIINSSRRKGTQSVRRALYRLATGPKANITAIIWFTKNYMGFKDRAEVETTPPVINLTIVPAEGEVLEPHPEALPIDQMKRAEIVEDAG